jgi:hypothetical protein
VCSQGVKVKDDPKLLRKTLKREEKKREKSAKAWAERKKSQFNEMKARLDARNDHVRDRKQVIVAKKLKKNKKVRKE